MPGIGVSLLAFGVTTLPLMLAIVGDTMRGCAADAFALGATGLDAGACASTARDAEGSATHITNANRATVRSALERELAKVLGAKGLEVALELLGGELRLGGGIVVVFLLLG